MNEIKRLKGRTLTHQIGIWLPERDKATYDVLRKEYGVDMAKEVREVITRRIHEIRAQVIDHKDIA